MWSNLVKKISYKSCADNTFQPARVYTPELAYAVPLLIGLHPWSADFDDSTYGNIYAQWCIEHNWAFIHPDFRGPNIQPQTCGSDFATEDIISAIDYMSDAVHIDCDRIYLIGVSGGGHVALLMAGKYPNHFTAVSAWVPITDLTQWYYDCLERNLKYAEDIIVCCGGVPEPGSNAESECRKRSPITYIARSQSYIDINAGINDGHDSSVPVSHSLKAFNILASPEDRLNNAQIEYFVTNKGVPPELKTNLSDPLYGSKKLLFRRQSNNIRVSIFDGGHEIICNAALNWLSMQHKV